VVEQLAGMLRFDEVTVSHGHAGSIVSAIIGGMGDPLALSGSMDWPILLALTVGFTLWSAIMAVVRKSARR
jgi:hypothetical protein